jgi:hypothetical protein
MKNYKTTIVGLIGAIWVAIQPIISSGKFDFADDWKSLVGAAIVACLGFVAKDYDVTGGTRPQGNA